MTRVTTLTEASDTKAIHGATPFFASVLAYNIAGAFEQMWVNRRRAANQECVASFMWTRPVTRGSKPLLKNVSPPPGKMCWTRFKRFENSAPCCPKLVTGLTWMILYFVQCTQSGREHQIRKMHVHLSIEIRFFRTGMMMSCYLIWYLKSEYASVCHMTINNSASYLTGQKNGSTYA